MKNWKIVNICKVKLKRSASITIVFIRASLILFIIFINYEFYSPMPVVLTSGKLAQSSLTGIRLYFFSYLYTLSDYWDI